MDDQARQDIIRISKALGHEKRLSILQWLKAPRSHFPVQTDGSRVGDGVCSSFIAQKLGVSDATASDHLKLLKRAGLVIPKRIKKWTFYQRDEKGIKRAMKLLSGSV